MNVNPWSTIINHLSSSQSNAQQQSSNITQSTNTPFTSEQMISLVQLFQLLEPQQQQPQSHIEKYSPYYILGMSMIISAVISGFANWYGLKEDITKLHSSVDMLVENLKEQKILTEKVHVIDKDVSVMRSQLDTHVNNSNTNKK
jgi:hypothetical protein